MLTTPKVNLSSKAMLINLKRVIKFGWQSLWRNKALTFQAVFIMAVAIFVITSFFFAQGIAQLLIEEVEKKVDIAVYFKKEVEEKRILQVKEELWQFREQIESVEYVSKEEALDDFLSKHQNDPLWLGALEQVEGNPFSGALNIKSKGPSQYAQISSFLEADVFASLIDRISYNQNKKVIDKLFSITSIIETLGLGLSLFLALIVVFITFNTIKLTILAKSQEIATSRLVGANNWFIRGPFLAQAIFYGLFAIVIVDLIFFSGMVLLGFRLEQWFLNFNAFSFLKANLLIIVSAQILVALLLGTVSSLTAVRKHLKV